MNKHLQRYISIVVAFIGLGNYNLLAQSTPDPGLPGTYSVVKAEYDFGDLAWKPPSFPDSVEVRGSVHYPTPLSAGPFPVIFFLHGRHDCCYDTTNPANVSSDWPCRGTYKSITSYEGYDYVARNMASHGYIVVSISCNAINAADDTVADYGMQGRGELLQHHFDVWNTFNTTGGAPFDSTFVGKLDMQNIGTMGHSRGGEGVIFNALYNKSLGSPYGIKAVITLAPVDFLRHVMHGIPLLNVAPYCDGDVYDEEGVHFYDDSRYSDTTDQAPKHNVLMMGANHDFFNTVWTPGSYIAGGADDWLYYFSATESHCGTSAATRFDTTKQKAAFNAYASAFYRIYLGHENQFAPILEVKDIVPPTSSMLDSADVYVSYHPARADQLDFNRTDSLVRYTQNSLFDTVTESALVSSQICGGGLSEPDCGFTINGGQKPHSGTTSEIGLSEMGLRWNDTLAYYENKIPAANENLSGYQYLLFRAAVNFRNSTSGVSQDFSVLLTDSAGNTSNQYVTNYSHALFYEPGSEPYDLPKAMFNTISVPLNAFTGVDLKKIRSVKFLFNRTAAGSILVSDLAFTNPLCGNSLANFNYTLSTRYHMSFSNQTIAYGGDSLTWRWNFGDPLSGVNDSSALQNPNHIFSGPGAYNTCLYVTAYRKNGLVCIDSMCSNIVLANDGVPVISMAGITISPNPAKDMITVTGASAGATLRMCNVYGQQVLETNLKETNAPLPSGLATGIYYITIEAGLSKMYYKLLIER